MNRLNFNSKRCAIAAVVLACGISIGCGPVADDGIDQHAVDRAHSFLSSPELGAEIISYMHMGAEYKGHEYLQTRLATQPDGTPNRGYFGLVYRFAWGSDGYTNVEFLCDPSGTVTGLRVLNSNGLINQPFFVAHLSVELLGQALINSFKDQVDSRLVQQAQAFIDQSDVKGLLETDIKMKQAART